MQEPKEEDKRSLAIANFAILICKEDGIVGQKIWEECAVLVPIS